MVKIYDDIVLFGKRQFEWTKNNTSVEKELMDFYVSDANNKNTLGTGKEWSKNGHWINKEYVKVDGVEIHTENKGFTLSLDSSADYSSQGGKLSFWMCKIDKGDIHGRIGINQEELNQLLKESTFINGVCQQEVCFYRANNNVGACVVGGERYKAFYEEKAKDIALSKAKKTTKWELGRVYETKTTKSVWVGDVTNYFTGEKHHLVLRVEDNDKTLKDVFKGISIYDNNLFDKFPSKIATDIVFDTSECSKILVEVQREEIIKNIDKMILYFNENKGCYQSMYPITYLAEYYIDLNDFQKSLIVDYLFLFRYYRHLENERYYSRFNSLRVCYDYDNFDSEFNLAEEYLGKLGYLYENIEVNDVDDIIEKYE